MTNGEFKKLSLRDKKEWLKNNSNKDEWSTSNPNIPIDECDDIETKYYLTYIYPKIKRGSVKDIKHKILKDKNECK